MVTWGVMAIATGFVHTPRQFYWVRFLLGLSEAGFFPGMVVYLSHWVRREERAQAMAWFMAAQPISNIVGAPISGWLLGIHWLGWPGWRWLFVLEGLPAVVLGFVTFWYLTDWPHQAKWLPADERAWLQAALDRERQALHAERPAHFWHAFRRREVILLTFACFGMASSIYAFNFFLPTLLKRMSGLPNFTISTIAMIPYCVGLLAIIFVGWSSDRTGNHKAHTAACMGLIALGLLLSHQFQNSIAISVAAFCLAAIGMYGYLPAFWSLPAGYLTGTAAAASVGLINSVGNLGGFFGPSIVGYLTQRTHSFGAGVLVMAGLAAMSATMVLLLPKPKRASRAG
jgi:MFS family permease